MTSPRTRQILTVARALAEHTYPCSSMVDEIMNKENPMFDRANSARLKATGQTDRDWFIQMAEKALDAYETTLTKFWPNGTDVRKRP